MVSHPEEVLLYQLRAYELPTPQRQYRFVAEVLGKGKGLRARLEAVNLQDWRFDFAWVDIKLATEVEGGTWVNGGHNRGRYYEDNCRKYNAALAMGWRVLRYTTDMVMRGEAIEQIRKVLSVEDLAGGGLGPFGGVGL